MRGMIQKYAHESSSFYFPRFLLGIVYLLAVQFCATSQSRSFKRLSSASKKLCDIGYIPYNLGSFLAFKIKLFDFLKVYLY